MPNPSLLLFVKLAFLQMRKQGSERRDWPGVAEQVRGRGLLVPIPDLGLNAHLLMPCASACHLCTFARSLRPAMSGGEEEATVGAPEMGKGNPWGWRQR